MTVSVLWLFLLVLWVGLQCVIVVFPDVYLNLSIFTVFLNKRNFISKIRISKVTDYAALIGRAFFILPAMKNVLLSH